MKTPKIEDVAKRKERGRYGPTTTYTCKFCSAEISGWYDDTKNVRSHMLRKHRMEYYATVPYVINEEADHLWSLAK